MEFKTYRAYYDFKNHVLRNFRYVFDESTKQFLEAILNTSHSRKRIISLGSTLWRAQGGHSWETISQDSDPLPAPHDEDRMSPLVGEAREGRANPKGIPCLYLATDKETAMAEVRPTLGSMISVGQFRILRELELVDCSVGHDSELSIYFEEPDAPEREKAVWNEIDRAFSEPITSGDSLADYAPTQILSELFKKEGYDGIIYKSNLGSGYNVSLFNMSDAEITDRFLFNVKSIRYDFDKWESPFAMDKDCGSEI